MPVGFSGFPVAVGQRRIPTGLAQVSDCFAKASDSSVASVKWPMPSKNIDGRMEGSLSQSWCEFWCLPLLSHSTAVEHNGLIYIFGGYLRTAWYADQSATNRMWVFNPDDLSIVEMGVQPISARYYHSACVYDGKMWIFGGHNGTVLSDLWAFDFQTGNWIQHGIGSTCPARQQCGRQLVVVNSKLMVYGGIDNSGTTLDSVWQYDPTREGFSDSWTAVDNGSVVPAARRAHTVWAYNNKMYVAFGSNSGGSLLSESWEFDPSASGVKWVSLSTPSGWTKSHSMTFMHSDNKAYIVGGGNHLVRDMQNAVWTQGVGNYENLGGQASEYVNGRVYCFGASSSYGRSMIEYLDCDQNRMYGVTQDERVWGSRSNHQMCAYKGKVYVMGGRGMSRYNTEWTGGIWHNCDIYEFDTNTKKTRVVGVGADNCQWGTMHAYNDKLFMVGGEGNGGAPTFTLRVFDLNSRQWTMYPMPTEGSIAHSSVLWNGTIYLHGGYGYGLGEAACRARMWAFDCTSMKWKQLSDSPRRVWGHSAFPYNGKIYHMFGRDQSGAYTNDAYVYTIATDTWSIVPTYTSGSGSRPTNARYFHEAFGWRNQMFICSGNSDYGDTWELDLNTMTWRQVDSIFGTGPGRRSCYEDNVAYILGARVDHYYPAPEIISCYS